MQVSYWWVPLIASHQLQLTKPMHCRKVNCPGNYISYIKNSEGYHADLVLTHYKNDSIKGTQYIRMAKQFLDKFALLHQAQVYLAPTSPILFFMSSSDELYEDAYWSTVCSKALSLPDKWITSKDFRHLFGTAWRDFINCPRTKLLDLTVKQLDTASADMMSSSTEAMDKAYDDSTRDRNTQTVMLLMPKFRKFIHDAHELKLTEV